MLVLLKSSKTMQQELFVEFKNTASQFIYLVVDNVCVKGFMDTE